MFLRLAYAFESEPLEIARKKVRPGVSFVFVVLKCCTKIGQHLVSCYIKDGSPREVNIDHKMRQAILKRFNAGCVENSIFVPARR